MWGTGLRISRKELDELEADLLAHTPGIVRANLRYSGTEPLLRVMLESDGKVDESGWRASPWVSAVKPRRPPELQQGISIYSTSRAAASSQSMT